VAIGAHRGSSYQPYLDLFSTSTLRRAASSRVSFATDWGQSPSGGGLVADAADGDVLTIDGNSVVSLQPSTGAITSSVEVPGASLLLYGSHPSVVASHLGVSYLVRLGSAGRTGQLSHVGTGLVAPATPQAAAPVGLARFSPVSATYISASTGWVLGTTTCASACGLVLLRTEDDGAHWVSVRLPVDKVDSDAQSAGPLQIRFADNNDGWLWATMGSVTGDVTGWSTHNGGGSWSKLSFPGASPGVEDIEASDGFVHAALQVGDAIQIVSSPVATDRWHRTGGPYELGAGPVPQGQFALQGAAGWFVQNDRVVISGGRLSPSGRWQKWAPPCATKGGPAILAAPSPNRLDAVCTEGPWTAPVSQPPSVHFLTSGNAGSTFSELSGPPGNSAYAASAIGSGTVAVAVSQPHYSGVVLVMSFDGGQSWHAVYRHSGLGTYMLGFTTPSQGVAIIASVDNTQDLMLQTRDGGHTWAPVSFG
jgi:hypothetical protein